MGGLEEHLLHLPQPSTPLGSHLRPLPLASLDELRLLHGSGALKRPRGLEGANGRASAHLAADVSDVGSLRRGPLVFFEMNVS